MKQINTYISERLHINKDIKSYNYHPKTRDELQDLVNNLIEERGNKADLNDIDTSEITDMTALFYNSSFNGDISKWDTSNVKDMRYMFYRAIFNRDISKWDVSNVEDMQSMFESSEFNGDISEWDVSNVKDMHYMFTGTSLEKNPPK